MNIIKLHRISNWCFRNKLSIVAKFTELLIFLVFNSRVPAKVRIGRNSIFAYGGIGCVLHKDTIIGENCIIGQSITTGGRGPRKGVPVIGNNVYFGPGCRVLGPILVGDNVIIGPNAVVISDVPSGSVVVGVPGKIVKTGLTDISRYL